MNDFDLYSKLLNTQETIHQECSHNDLTEQGIPICRNCGIEVFKNDNPISSVQSISHCYIRNLKNKSIYDDVKSLNISDHIKDLANDIYTQICGTKVHRGKKRKAILFASIYHAYKMDNNPQSYESLKQIFDIQKKDALKGLKYLNEFIPKSIQMNVYITPEHLIVEYMNRFNSNENHIKQVLQLYLKIKNKSLLLSRSHPQSIAGGIIFYYISFINRAMTLKEFVKKINLSELTINKIMKEIDRILKEENEKSENEKSENESNENTKHTET